MPVLIMIGLVSWVLSIYITHYERLEKGNIPSEFKQFSLVSTILFFIELSLLYAFFKNQFSESKILQKKDNSVMAKSIELLSSQSTMLLYLLTSISAISIGIMQTIVNYYLTDG